MGPFYQGHLEIKVAGHRKLFVDWKGVCYKIKEEGNSNVLSYHRMNPARFRSDKSFRSPPLFSAYAFVIMLALALISTEI